MHMKFALPLVAALALGACSGGAEDESAGEDGAAVDVAGELAAAGDMIAPEPGKYATKMQVLEFEVPGLSDDQVAMMRGIFEQAATEAQEYCLTAEDAAKGAQQMADSLADSECEWQKFDISGNSLDAAGTCPGEEGMTATIALQGTMAATSSSMVMTAEQEVPQAPGGGVVKFKMQADSERVGECD